MTLYELLKTADVADIVKNGQIERFDEDMTVEEKEVTYLDFVNRLLKLTPNENVDRGILIGHMVQDSLDEGYTEPRADISLYHLGDLLRAHDDIKRIVGMPDVNGISDNELEQFFKAESAKGFDHEIIPNGYAYEFSEWEDILGWAVDEENVREIGKSNFLSYILYEMSFNGFFEDSQEERRADLKRGLEEFEKLKEMPKEERDKHFVSSDDVFKELSDKFSVEWHKPTKEEQEESSRKIRRDSMFNLQSSAKVLYRLLENRIAGPFSL